MNEYLHSYYKKIKENVTMIAIVPTVLGGIWQLWMLGSISSNMIRFFSISQLISDGLLLLVFFVFPVSIILQTIKNRRKDNTLQTETPNQYVNVLVIVVVIIFVTLIFTLLTIGWLISDIRTIIQLKELSSLWKFLFLLSFLTTLVYVLFGKFIDRILTFGIFVSIVLITNIAITLVCFYKVSKDILSIENIQVLLHNIEKEDCYSKAPEILYFNDKYIFIALEKKNKKSILIKKFDALFEE
jgi:magnesium-transporting ATPase (P-type)